MSTGTTRRWKLGFLAGLNYATMPATDVIASLAGIGYEAVEWTLAHLHPRETTPAQRREVVTACADAGLAISELCAQQDVVCLDEATREDRIALYLESIAVAAECGIGVVNVFTGPCPWDPAAPVVGDTIRFGAAWDLVFSAFDRLVPAAESAGVALAVEGVFGMLCRDYYSALRLIQHYDSPALGVNFDPSHDILVGNVDSGDLVRAWGRERIHHVHLKDAVGIDTPGKFLFPLLGEGLVPWDDFFGALDEIGYDGVCSVEYESFAYHTRVLKGDSEAAARLSYNQVQRLLAGG